MNRITRNLKPETRNSFMRTGLLVIFALLFLVFFIFRRQGARHHRSAERFSREYRQLIYTKHARCRMNCRHIDEQEVQEILEWLLLRSPEQAGRWHSRLAEALASLTEMPTRCPLAPEDDLFTVEVRQLLVQSHRVLFTLVASEEGEEPSIVRVLHVRHAARRRLNESPDAAPSS